MRYSVKVVKIADYSEWQPNPDNPSGGAGPNVPGAWLARRVTVETSNTDENGNLLSVYEVRDLLVPEPYSTEALAAVIGDYKQTLPARNPDEGLVF